MGIPQGIAEWPLPKEPARQSPEQGTLKVDLEHGVTGSVGESMEVRVVVHRTTQSIQDFKVRILPSEGATTGSAATGSDKFFHSGPTNTQAVLVSSPESVPQVLLSFMVVPLRPGWLAVPRVQVTSGNQDVTSGPTSIFIFPSPQPVLWRSNC